MQNRPHRMLASLLELLYGPERADRGRTCWLMSREWELADEIHNDDLEYLVLRRRITTGCSLTSRERTAVQLAMGGSTNKEIAWLFGVSASTVGVFLWRAARKLGVTGRDALLRAFAERYPDEPALDVAACAGNLDLRTK